MINKLQHTPEGVRDIYGDECEKKQTVLKNMQEVLSLYGFKDIQTPTFEFFDVFNTERGIVPSKEMYKFFDHEGNTLVLRPDITPSVARCVSKYYKNEEFPIRLSYVGNTFINKTGYQGKLKENTQLGAELFNDDKSDADAEMIAICIECLLKAGLEEFQIEIGHVDYFNGLMEETGLSKEEIEEYRALVNEKNLFSASQMLSSKQLDENLKESILELSRLFGNIDVLSKAKGLTSNEKALKAIERLEKIYSILEAYGFDKYITFDLGMLSKSSYYTGIIFKAYTYGNGEPIASGGRYDNLLADFEKSAAAIGLVLMVDQLMIAMSRQKIQIELCKKEHIIYELNQRETAIKMANDYRNKGINVELIRKSSRKSLEDYKEFAKRGNSKGLIYIGENGNIEEFDFN